MEYWTFHNLPRSLNPEGADDLLGDLYEFAGCWLLVSSGANLEEKLAQAERAYGAAGNVLKAVESLPAYAQESNDSRLGMARLAHRAFAIALASAYQAASSGVEAKLKGDRAEHDEHREFFEHRTEEVFGEFALSILDLTASADLFLLSVQFAVETYWRET